MGTCIILAHVYFSQLTHVCKVHSVQVIVM